MPTPSVTGIFSSSNYTSFDGSNENLTMLGAKVALRNDLSVSLGFGNDCTVTKDGNGFYTTKNKPAIEVKAKYNIKNLNTQLRFREIGGDEQYRIAFGGNYSFDKHNSIYAALHATTKYTNEWKHNAGIWVGYTHTFKNGISISGELQQNIPLNKGSKGFGETISSMDANKMVNVMLTVPIK